MAGKEGWVRGNVYLGDNVKLLGIRQRTAIMHGMPGFSDNPIDPGVLSDWAKEFIESRRPELQGVTIYFVEYDPFHHAWTFGCVHPSFPALLFATRLEIDWLLEKNDNGRETA